MLVQRTVIQREGMEETLSISQPNLEKTKLLQEYFEKEMEVLMAFLFGSRAKSLATGSSDWDVRVYFKPSSKTTYEAIDFWNFVYNFWKIRERARSLSPVSPNLPS